MDNSINFIRITLAILFVIYQIWTFRNNKSITIKLLPMILMIVLGLMILVLAPFVGTAGFFMIFVILAIELSLVGVMIVLLFEICLALFSSKRNLKRAVVLAVVFISLIVIYYLAERVF